MVKTPHKQLIESVQALTDEELVEALVENEFEQAWYEQHAADRDDPAYKHERHRGYVLAGEWSRRVRDRQEWLTGAEDREPITRDDAVLAGVA